MVTVLLISWRLDEGAIPKWAQHWCSAAEVELRDNAGDLTFDRSGAKKRRHEMIDH